MEEILVKQMCGLVLLFSLIPVITTKVVSKMLCLLPCVSILIQLVSIYREFVCCVLGFGIKVWEQTRHSFYS